MENKIFVSGINGFVGNAVKHFFSYYTIVSFFRGKDIEFQGSNVVIHLAGKAHDLKNVSSPQEYYKANTELTKEIFNLFI